MFRNKQILHFMQRSALIRTRTSSNNSNKIVIKFSSRYFSVFKRPSSSLAGQSSNGKPYCRLRELEIWTPGKVRQVFLDYFVNQNDHVFVPSSSVVPHKDSNLLYTNAGMNQFKPILLGQIDPNSHMGSLRRVTNYQKCVRVGGKHNDFDDVGKDGYHHTFFEMLGNWSFGDYFKKDACELAFKLLTGPYGLPLNNIYVTYFGGDSKLNLPPDEECQDIWLQLGLPNDHVLPFGMKDNFWDMGDSGPCGPCSEIHYSHLGSSGEAQRLVNAGSPDVIEIWNLVFMQFNRTLGGILETLPKCHVDTGMGFERLVAVLQSSFSNYDTELFRPLFAAIEKEVGCPAYSRHYGVDDVTGTDTAFRIIADHARMSTICLSDGVIPSNIEAGHCLRRAIRRAVMMSSRLTADKSIPRGLMGKLVPRVAESLGEAYPEILHDLTKVTDAILEEEDKFLQTVSKGIAHFRTAVVEKDLSDNIFSAELMWRLYSYFGVPEDMIQDLAASRGLVPEWDKFKFLMASEKQKNKQAYRDHVSASNSELFDSSVVGVLNKKNVPTTDDKHKYDYRFDNRALIIPKLSSRIVGLWNGEQFVDILEPLSKNAAVVTKETNFYSQAGGQLSDVGSIVVKGACFSVEKVSLVSGYVLHHGTLTGDRICCGDVADLEVDEAHREGCTRNHTATHLLNAALCNFLDGVEQRSSHVASDYLRFAFSTKFALSDELLAKVEAFVQNVIRSNFRVHRTCMPLTHAKRLRLMKTVPGEMYPDTVSLITISKDSSNEVVDYDSAISLEACCGTHLQSTDAIREFVIVSQKPLGQAVRSLMAITGPQASSALELGRELSKTVQILRDRVKDYEILSNEKKLIDLSHIHKELAGTRSIVTNADISAIVRHELDSKIEELQRIVSKIMRTQIRGEFKGLLTESKTLKHLVYRVKSAVDNQIVFVEIPKQLPKIPLMVFSEMENVIHGRCLVPKSCVRPDFNAALWLRQSLSKVPKANPRPYHNSPETDCVVTFGIEHSDLLPDALRVANEVVLKLR